MAEMTSLQDDLIRITGVEAAELEGDAETPDGVRVRLGAGIDAGAVGDEIRGVLAAHGLRSELFARTEAASPEGVDTRETAAGAIAADVGLDSGSPPADPKGPFIATPPVTSSLESVGVIETREGVVVEVVDSDGGRSVVRARPEPGALDEAVVRAVAQLAGWEPVPLILATVDHQAADSTVVTVVLDGGRTTIAGSAVVEGGRVYAVGRAVWAALSSV